MSVIHSRKNNWFVKVLDVCDQIYWKLSRGRTSHTLERIGLHVSENTSTFLTTICDVVLEKCNFNRKQSRLSGIKAISRWEIINAKDNATHTISKSLISKLIRFRDYGQWHLDQLWGSCCFARWKNTQITEYKVKCVNQSYIKSIK